MPKRGKKYREALAKIDRENYYEPRDALQLVKEIAPAKFDESVEVAVRLGIDTRHADQQVRGLLCFPMGQAKPVKFSSSLKGIRPRRRLKPVPITWERRIWYRRSRKGGSISRWPLLHRM